MTDSASIDGGHDPRRPARPDGSSAPAAATAASAAPVLSVVVTGGVRGIGAGIARAFLAAGASVLVCARRPPSTPLPEADGRQASFVVADVRKPADCAALVQAALARFGRLDVVVNNAGGTPYLPAAEAAPSAHEKIVVLNLLAPLHVAQAANAVMQTQPDGGTVIMIGSVSGVRPSPGSAAYGAAKAGMAHLATSLAIEWAPKVRVNTVVAGMIATEASEDHYGGPGGLARVAATVPAGRMGTPQDVAGACLFLASPQAAYMSGASLLLHGGGERPVFLAATEPPATTPPATEPLARAPAPEPAVAPSAEG